MSSFPVTRLRRLRRSDRLRALVRETRLDLDDFVLPLFVGPATEPNPELPALGRFSVEDLAAEAEDATRLGVRAVLLFGIPDEKDAEGSGAWDDDGVIQRALRALRETSPGLVLLTDVCLCEYTSHGHCGVLEADEVDNDATLELLARTAVSHAAAGADALLIKPALPNLDVLRAVRERFDLPIGAYNVSGEYAMLKAAGAKGWLDERQAALESLTAIKRAGADLVVSYWTKELAGWL